MDPVTPQQFEADTRWLLELQGWRVQSEVLLGHKKIDAYVEKLDNFGSMERVALECKKWAEPLSQNDVTTIYMNYHPLIVSNLVDYVLIVTNNGITASAETYVQNAKTLRHLTYQRLLNALINFRVHLQGVTAAYLHDESFGNYIPQSYREGPETLEDALISWIEGHDSRPIAILGGYGIGKTTLAKRVAYRLAQQCISSQTSRVPVVLALASIATDQTLEGLLGRQFTAISTCPNYNYQLFLALNAKGRFVIFLDGFDEMKRTISWDTLIYNLEQLHQLIVPHSKVILLGRPSAFLTDEEHDEALHGRHKQLGQERTIPGWPDYRELHMLESSREKVATFIKRHLETLPPPTDEEYAQSRNRITKYLQNIESPEGRTLLDLASRPVQLSMLMQLLPEYTKPLDQLTTALLYSEFIDLLLRRENCKVARRSIPPDRRRTFASRLAYWMWKDNQRGAIDFSNIPNSLFAGIIPATTSHDVTADIKRDLLSGGFLDRRPPNTYYFPHRSFQEYLVADELASLSVRDPNSLNYCSFLTPEVISFFVEIIGKVGTSKLRARWNYPKSPSKQLRDLINTGCAYYDLPLLQERPSPTPRKHSVDDGELNALFRTLQISEVVSEGRLRGSKKYQKTKTFTSAPPKLKRHG